MRSAVNGRSINHFVDEYSGGPKRKPRPPELVFASYSNQPTFNQYREYEVLVIKPARITQLLFSALCLLACVLFTTTKECVVAQKQTANDKAWLEVASSEGRFRVLMPDTPNEISVPINGQIVHTEGHAFFVRTPVAFYAVLFTDFPGASTEPEMIRAAFDSGRDRAMAEGKLILISEKGLSNANMPAREYVFDDGAFIIKTRVYYIKGRLYQAIFGAPGVNGMPAAMAQYYDGLAAKFFNSFKVGS